MPPSSRFPLLLLLRRLRSSLPLRAAASLRATTTKSFCFAAAVSDLLLRLLLPSSQRQQQHSRKRKPKSSSPLALLLRRRRRRLWETRGETAASRAGCTRFSAGRERRRRAQRSRGACCVVFVGWGGREGRTRGERRGGRGQTTATTTDAPRFDASSFFFFATIQPNPFSLTAARSTRSTPGRRKASRSTPCRRARALRGAARRRGRGRTWGQTSRASPRSLMAEKEKKMKKRNARSRSSFSSSTPCSLSGEPNQHPLFLCLSLFLFLSHDEFWGHTRGIRFSK